MGSTSTPAEPLGAAPAHTAGKSDHLVKLGEDVFLLESEQPVKHDPEHPNVSQM